MQVCEVETKQALKRSRLRRNRNLSIGIIIHGLYATATSKSCYGWSNRISLLSGYHYKPASHTLPLHRHHHEASKAFEAKVLSMTTISTLEADSSTVYSSPLLNSATFSSQLLMDPIVHHPSLQLLELERRPRKKLKPRHKIFFLPSSNSSSGSSATANPPTLFEKLALACCDSGVVPRKEFFETYAAAKFIQDSFPKSVYRIADLAAGHGLLSWMLLAMDEYSETGVRKESSERCPRTAICVDRRMPPSAIAIARSMRTHLFPIEVATNKDCNGDGDDDTLLYDSRWTYVETDLRNVVVDDASTLLVSVHACGTLSDFLIQMAVSERAPISLVPCCHTFSARKGYTPHPLFSGTTAEEVRTKIHRLQKETENDLTHTSTTQTKTARKTKTHQKFQIVENVIDEVRWITLRNAGYGNVRIASLPKEFTERNRLFLAHKQDDNGDESLGETIVQSKQTTEKKPKGVKTSETATVRKAIRRGSMPPARASDFEQSQGQAENNLPIFKVHVKDDPKSIEDCLSVSGKAKAIERLRALLPNHFAPKLDVSMWLSPPLPDGVAPFENSSPLTNVTTKALQTVLDDVVVSYRQDRMNQKDSTMRYRCTISPMNEIFVHPKNGRKACTYQIEYSYESSTIEENGAPFPKSIAKELHKSFCESVVRCIDGTAIR